MKHREHSLQIAVAHMLTVVLDPAKTWWSSIDHGVGKLGLATAGIRKRRGVRQGLPDVIVVVYGCVIGIELKIGKGSLSPAQVEVRDAWLTLGHGYYVARTLEEVQEILEHCRVPMRRQMNFMGGNHGQPAVRSPAIRHKRTSRRRRPEGPMSVV